MASISPSTVSETGLPCGVRNRAAFARMTKRSDFYAPKTRKCDLTRLQSTNVRKIRQQISTNFVVFLRFLAQYDPQNARNRTHFRPLLDLPAYDHCSGV